MDPKPRNDAFALLQVSGGVVDEFLGYDAVTDYPLVRVDIIDEEVKGINTLDESLLKIGEILFGNDARNRIEGKELFIEDTVLVYTELHSVTGQQLIDRFSVSE